MLVSSVLPEYSMDLVITVVFLRNSEHKVLDRCEYVSEKYQKETFIRQCPAQSTKSNKDSQNDKEENSPVEEKLDY